MKTNKMVLKYYLVVFLIASFIANTVIAVPLIIYLRKQVRHLSEEVVIDPIVTLTNYERQMKGIVPLKQNSKLAKSAQDKACDMINDNYFDHISPDGKHFFEFLSYSDYYYIQMGENLCAGASDENCMQMWMESPTHRDNILESNYIDIGIGRCGNYIVQHFGSKE